MNVTKKRAAFLLAGVIATLAACGGGGSTGSAPSPSGTTSVQGAATITIPNKAPQSGARSPRYVSGSVLSATVAIGGSILATADLSPLSSLCRLGQNENRTCTIPIVAPVGTDTFTVTLYDAAGGHGNVLGIGSATLAVSAANFTLPLTIGGVPKTVALFADTTLYKGTPATIAINVQVKDAGGNTIFGTEPFASPITLTNNDDSGHTHLSLTQSGTGSGNIVLTAPTSTVFLVYDGGNAGNNVTIGATGGGVTTITPAIVPVIQPSPTPTAVPTVPSLSFGTGGYSCNGTSQLTLPGNYLLMISIGELNTGGDYLNEQSEWAPIQFLAASPAPSPSGSPTVTPSATPIPSFSPSTQVTLYSGTFTLSTPFNGQTGGCIYVVYFPNQQFVAGERRNPRTATGSPSPSASPSPSPQANTFVIGAPNVGNNVQIGTVGTIGTVSTLNLHVDLAAATGSGNFVLDNQQTGTITINGRFSFFAAEKRLAQSVALQRAFAAARARQHP